MVAAIERGYPQQEIHDAAYAYQQAIERADKIVVGVNDYVSEEKWPIKLLQIDDSVAQHQRERLADMRKKRDRVRVGSALESLGIAASGDENLMPFILECVRAYATVGEMCDVLRNIFGTYEEPAFR
jgi:methylmalonyl-CoA mutase N-terminal domain/subunit